jgi:hypothetical protein
MLIWPSLPLTEDALRPNKTILCTTGGMFFDLKMRWGNRTTFCGYMPSRHKVSLLSVQHVAAAIGKPIRHVCGPTRVSLWAAQLPFTLCVSDTLAPLPLGEGQRPTCTLRVASETQLMPAGLRGSAPETAG